MNLHQLSITYVPEQDRILARVNTQEGAELQFWLTRRLTLGLAPVLDKLVVEHTARNGGIAPTHVAQMDDIARKTVAQFQRAESLKSADFSTPYKPPAEHKPLFDHALLVTEVNLTPLSNGQMRLSCAEKLSGQPPDKQRNFQLGLSQQLLHAFVHLLERAIGQSQWRETGAPGAVAQKKAEPPAPERTGYLN
jgi:hypothetical protein